MPSATASLPSDPQALRALAASLQDALAAKERELAARDAEIHAKTLHIEKLRATLALMKRARFGQSSERLEQLELLIGDLEEETAEQEARQDAAVARVRPTATSGAPGAVSRCPPICRASGSSTRRPASARRAAAKSSAGSAATSARCWSMCRRTSRWWSTSGPR